MDAMMKECMKPHALVHSLAGLGVGLILAALAPGLATVMYGLIVIVVAIVLDFMVQKKG